MPTNITPLKESDFLELTSKHLASPTLSTNAYYKSPTSLKNTVPSTLSTNTSATQPYNAPASSLDPAPKPTAEMPEGMTPVSRELNPEQDTVAGQLSGLLASDSPYITEARQGAKEYANQRGLLNSSIAAGAGEQAAIQSALPIAQQDAQTYANQGLTNQQFGQEGEQINAGFRNDWEKANQAYENTWNIFQGEYDRKLEELDANIGGQLDLQTLKQTGSLDLENLRQRGDQLKLDQGSFGSYLNAHVGIQSMMLSEIQSVQQDEGLQAAQKQTALDEINDRYGESFEFIDQIFGEAAQSWDWDFIMGPPA